MKRREFTAGVLAAGLSVAVARPMQAQSSGSYKKVRMRLTNTSGDHKPYNVKKIADPTGSAPTRQVERFELRGGDCSSAGDCTARIKHGEMNARTRIERVFACDMKLGEEGLFRYSVYFPSNEYNLIDVVGSTFGQLLSAYQRGDDYDSYPIFSLDTDHYKNNWDLYAALSEMRFEEEDRVGNKVFRVGSLRNGGFMDRWINVQVRFKLSDRKDGYIEPVIDGRRFGRLIGPTLLPDGYPEARYGIYQNHTNLYPGGASQMPTQVVYFSNVGVYRLT